MDSMQLTIHLRNNGYQYLLGIEVEEEQNFNSIVKCPTFSPSLLQNDPQGIFLLLAMWDSK